MKILLSNVAVKDSPTGVFSRSFNLAKGLARNGNEVTLLSTQNNEFKFPFSEEKRDGVLIIAMPSFYRMSIKKAGYDLMPIFLKCIYVLFRKFDIVHSDKHRPTSFFPCVVHRFFRRSILISDWQDINGKTGLYEHKSKAWKRTLGPIDNWLEIVSIKNADGVVTLSKILGEKAIQFGKKNHQIQRIWGGSDLDKIKFHNSPITFRDKFNIPKDAFVIVFVGLEPMDYEDNLYVFRVLQKMRKRNHNIMVVRTGKPFSESFKVKHNIQDEILEVGYVSDKNYGDFLSCANTYMLMQVEKKNNLARWPNVIGDYIAAGRPIILNPIGELVELKQLFKKAIISIETKDECALESTLISIYEDSTSLSKYYKEIFEFAKASFSWDVKSRELNHFYSLLRQNKTN